MIDAQTVLWSAGTSVVALCGKFFFDKWNHDSEHFICDRECRHNRANCQNLFNLQVTHLTMQVEQLHGELQSIRAILLQVAAKSGVAIDKLTDLTK